MTAGASNTEAEIDAPLPTASLRHSAERGSQHENGGQCPAPIDRIQPFLANDSKINGAIRTYRDRKVRARPPRKLRNDIGRGDTKE